MRCYCHYYITHPLSRYWYIDRDRARERDRDRDRDIFRITGWNLQSRQNAKFETTELVRGKVRIQLAESPPPFLSAIFCWTTQKRETGVEQFSVLMEAYQWSCLCPFSDRNLKKMMRVKFLCDKHIMGLMWE